MSNIVVNKMNKLVERICDKLTDDKSKVTVYMTYRISRTLGILAMVFYLGAEAFNIAISLLG